MCVLVWLSSTSVVGVFQVTVSREQEMTLGREIIGAVRFRYFCQTRTSRACLTLITVNAEIEKTAVGSAFFQKIQAAERRVQLEEKNREFLLDGKPLRILCQTYSHEGWPLLSPSTTTRTYLSFPSFPSSDTIIDHLYLLTSVSIHSVKCKCFSSQNRQVHRSPLPLPLPPFPPSSDDFLLLSPAYTTMPRR